jgi:hypothetical protein
VNEHIFATIITHNKAKALLRVEKLYNACAFANDLCWHRRARCTTAAAESAATAAAAEAITATTTAETVTAAPAEAITAAATETITAATKAATEIIVAKTVALVSAASAALSATPSIKTHAVSYFLRISFARSNHKTCSLDAGDRLRSAEHSTPVSRDSLKYGPSRANLFRQA